MNAKKTVKCSFAFLEDGRYVGGFNRMLEYVPRVGDTFAWNAATKPDCYIQNSAIVLQVIWYDGPQPIDGLEDGVTMTPGMDVLIRCRLVCSACGK